MSRLRFVDEGYSTPPRRRTSLVERIREAREEADQLKELEEFVTMKAKEKEKKDREEKKKKVGLTARETFLLMLGSGPMIALAILLLAGKIH